MSEHIDCKDCFQKDTCQAVYSQMGKSDFPPVLGKVILAFLLPIIFFITSLFLIEKLLISNNTRLLNRLYETIPVNMHKLQTAVCFITALALTIIYIFIIRFFLRKHKQIV